MKRLSVIMIGLLFFGTLVFANGCQKYRRFQTVFPLEADEVVKRLEQVGLSGEISEDETDSSSNGRISYVIRDSADVYGGGGNSKMVANIVSLVRKDGRALSTVFVQNAADDAIVWADWEKKIVFATLLYGGFADKEALYKACIEAELPTDTKSFGWENDLSDGYCCVSYTTRKNKTFDESGYENVSCTAMLRVNIYESRELFEQMNEDVK